MAQTMGSPIPPRGGIETAEMAKADVQRQKKKPSTKPKPKPETKTKPETKAKKERLEDVVAANYPHLSYIFENPETFGQDVVNLLRRADKEQWEPQRFASALVKTNYWQTTVAAAKNFDAAPEADKQTKIDNTLREIRGVTDVANIDEAELNTFARDMARRGITGDNLRTLTYQLAFKKGAETEAAQRALYTQEAADMRRMAKMYGAVLDDTQIEGYLTQGKKATDLQAMYREKLKAQYPHLASQLDADMTFEDIISDYRQVAAQVLDTDAASIDFSKPEFLESVAMRDEKGNTRQMSLGEWRTKLKTDDRYGYANTSQAKQTANQLAFSLAQAFGRII